MPEILTAERSRARRPLINVASAVTKRVIQNSDERQEELQKKHAKEFKEAEKAAEKEEAAAKEAPAKEEKKKEE
jgi:hypothetical protein